MEVEGDFFWRQLRTAAGDTTADDASTGDAAAGNAAADDAAAADAAAEDADAKSQDELQQAEAELRQLEAELLSEGDHASLEALPPEQVEQWVTRALAMAPAAAAVRNSKPKHQPYNDHAATPRRARAWQSWLAAAAAFLITPKFLVAATVVAGIAVTGALLQRTTATLPFVAAVELLIDTEQPNATRSAAGGRVYFDVGESVQTIYELRDRATPNENLARAAIDSLLQSLQQPTPLVTRQFQVPLTELVMRLMVDDASVAQQQLWLQDLTSQVHYGIQALQSAASQTAEAELAEVSRLQLQNIEKMLSR